MPIVHVLDLVATRRAVTVPQHCRYCRADLTQPNALREWQLTDERWFSRLATDADADIDGAEGNGTVLDYDLGSDSGSSDHVHHGPVALYCVCGAELASGVYLEQAHGPAHCPVASDSQS